MTLADTFCTYRVDPTPPATPTGGHGPAMARPWPPAICTTAYTYTHLVNVTEVHAYHTHRDTLETRARRCFVLHTVLQASGITR